MSEVTGKLVACDRCGQQIFLRCTGEGEADGGFTRWNKFESLPDGWQMVAVPNSAGWVGSGNAYNGYMLACPTCYHIWEKVIHEGFLKGTRYYKEVTANDADNHCDY